MNDIGMNLTEYTSAEISVLLHAISVTEIDTALEKLFSSNESTVGEPKEFERRLEILQQWKVKLTEAREIVRKEENSVNN